MLHSSHPVFTYSVFLAGLLLAMAFAPFNFSYLVIIALAGLFWTWQDISASQAAIRGYLFGLGMFGFGVSWVYVSVHDYGHASAISSALLAAFFVSVWSIFPAIVAYFAQRLVFTKATRLNILVAPLLWTFFEYVRGDWVLNGFPWLQLAYSQIDTPLSGYIPVIGVYGTGFLVALTAALLVSIFKHRQAVFGLSVLAGVWLGGGLLKTITWTHPIGNALPVALVQGNISQDQKWLPGNKINTLIKYQGLTELHWDAKVIVWPESSIPAYLSEVEEFFVTPLEGKAKQHRTDLVVSLPLEENEALFNGVLSLGHERKTYKKKHLLPFGEYLPLQPFSGFVLDTLGIKLGHFTPGEPHQPLLEAGGYPFSTSICYEDAFGGEVIEDIATAAYLVNVTNDAWFGDSIEPHQHLQIARLRALETGRYMLRVTNTGVTAIIDPKGQIIKQVPLFQTVVLTGSILPMGGLTPYARIGDAGVMGVLSGIGICMACLGYRKSKKINLPRPHFQGSSGN